uniref:ATP synthase subunit a n=1 Tax=Ornebius fuscicerci TaxID=2153492 RepID=A0A385I208_9ORTH|nr:ATP synthase F0 subunit 6 [Ornebius fuscicerci]AXY63941.1 ATP synthase F0 subunit 6 [Ornebius fuscicerci]
MMTNLFSVFDPSTSILNWSFNWLSTMLFLIFIPFSFWFIPSRPIFLWNSIISTLYNEYKILLGPNSKGSTFIFIIIFSFIIMNNFMGLFPFIFTSTSHLTITLTLALPFWLTFMLYGWFNHTQHMFAHLVPQGTPTMLMPFMVCIETISNMIRPGTLAVRLTANMIAGHLLMTLLGNTGHLIMNSPIMLQFLVITQLLLLMLESAVAMIQAYVFAVLASLYCSEVT